MNLSELDAIIQQYETVLQRLRETLKSPTDSPAPVLLEVLTIRFVLDSCHSGGVRKGVMTLRSRPGDLELNRITNPTLQLLASPGEEAYQRRLMERLKIETPAELGQLRKRGVPKGIMLAAAQANQAAIERQLSEFYGTIFQQRVLFSDLK